MRKMKCILFIQMAMALSLATYGQNNYGKATDEDRIAIAPYIDYDQDIPSSSKNMLESRMKQVLTKNGMAAETTNAVFIMKAEVNEISKEITPTSPPMHAFSLEVVFSIVDRINGNVANSTSVQVRGVGTNENKAYLQAFKQINASSPQLRKFVDISKEKILEYYNSKCDDILKYANTLKEQGKNNEAISFLNSVPGISKECYLKCMELAASIEPTEVPQTSTQPIEEIESEENEPSTGGTIMEVKEGVFLSYLKNKSIGEKFIIDFQFNNTTPKDVEFYVNRGRVKIYDENGNVYDCNLVKFTNTSGAYVRGKIIPETPMNLTLEFEKPLSVKVFQIDIFDNTFRFKNISLQ